MKISDFYFCSRCGYLGDKYVYEERQWFDDEPMAFGNRKLCPACKALIPGDISFASITDHPQFRGIQKDENLIRELLPMLPRLRAEYLWDKIKKQGGSGG